MTENQPKMDVIRENFGAFCSLCDPTLLDTLRERVEDQSQEWQRIEGRLQAKITDLKVRVICFFSSSASRFYSFEKPNPIRICTSVIKKSAVCENRDWINECGGYP